MSHKLRVTPKFHQAVLAEVRSNKANLISVVPRSVQDRDDTLTIDFTITEPVRGNAAAARFDPALVNAAIASASMSMR